MRFSRRWPLIALPVVILLLHTVLAYIGIIGFGLFGVGRDSGPELEPVVRVADLLTQKERDNLLFSVVEKNAATMAGIESYIVEWEWTRRARHYLPQNMSKGMVAAQEGPGDGALVESRTILRIVRKGRMYVVSRRDVQKEVYGEWEGESASGAVLNDDYFAQYFESPSGSIHLWDHPSIDAMDPKSQGRADREAPIPLYWYGGSEAYEVSLAKRMELYPDDTVWTIEDSVIDGSPVYLISGTRIVGEGEGRVWVSRYFVDPRQGHLFRRIEHDVPRHKPAATVKVALAYSESSRRWYPQHVVKKDLQNNQDLDMRVTHFEVNPAIEDGEIAIEALDLKEGTVLSRYASEKSRPLHYRYVDGAWVR